MKLFFTLIIIFTAAAKIPAQKISVEAGAAFGSAAISVTQPCEKLRAGCCINAKNNYREPLLVIDGVLHEFNEIHKLDPDDIVSIDILKEAAATALFGCRAATAVIIITTKTGSNRKFIIKDFLNGQTIPLATVCFTSKNDTITAVANDNGILVTDKLKSAVKYDITVSSAGYKTFSTSVGGKQQAILLERDIKECSNVIVSQKYSNVIVSQTSCPQKIISCGYLIRKIITEKGPTAEDKVVIKPVYPNPVQRSRVFNLELENTQDETIQLAIISLNGSTVSLQSKKITKGLNHLFLTADVKWAAGIYNIQLRNKKGTLIRQEKLVVQ